MAGKRRFSIYWTWSYPWEANRDLTELDNRFSTMTEVRRVAWPAFEGSEWDKMNFLQGIAGTLELFHRSTLAFLIDAFDEDEIEGETRVVLRLHPKLAPYKAAVFPLLRKDGQPERARRIYDALRAHFPVDYDQAGSIGRRYRRQDEVGTPYGITVDHQTMQDGTVTLRDRDATTQVRIPEDRLVEELRAKIG